MRRMGRLAAYLAVLTISSCASESPAPKAQAPTQAPSAKPVSPAERLARLAKQGKVVPMQVMPAGAIKVDGDVSEWGAIADGGMVLDEHLNAVVGQVDAKVKGAAGFKVARDDANFYIAIRVVDRSLLTRSPAYMGDAIELFLDTRPLTGDGPKLGEAKYSAGVWQMSITPPIKVGEQAKYQLGLSGGPMGPIEVAGKCLPDGYSIEMKMPFASLNGATAARFDQPIGIDIGVDDIDEIAGQGVTERVQYTLGGSPNSWMDAAVFGVADVNAKPAADGCLRRVGASLQATATTQRFLTGGMVVRGLSSDPRDPKSMEVNCTYLGKTPTAPMQEKVALGEAADEVTQYPQLGATVYRVSRPITALKRGKYEVVTSFTGTDVHVKRKFDSGVWPAEKIAAAPWKTPADMVLPNTVDPEGRTILASGRKLSPAGNAMPLPGDLPVKMVWSADGKYLLVQTAGFHDPAVNVVDVSGGRIVQTVNLPRSWPGMGFDADGKTLYVSTGVGEDGDPFKPVLSYAWDGAKLTPAEALKSEMLVKKKTWTSGLLGVNVGGQKLLCVLDEQQGVAGFVSPDSLAVRQKVEVGYHPYAAAMTSDGKLLAVSNWGDESVSLIGTSTWTAKKVTVGSHPNELLWTRDGRLMVACSGSNAVCVIKDGRLIETIRTSLTPDAPVGSTPIALAISPDQKRLYVANADNNDVAVIDIAKPGQSEIEGFIPTGWYPSAIAVNPDGKMLYVGVGKGMSFSGNTSKEYIGSMLNGAICAVPVPDGKTLEAYTKQVIANLPRGMSETVLSAQDAQVLKEVLPKIKHVLFIIRENRTYDQVLGDIAGANGDATLTMYGREITPNGHRIAKDFVLLDNLFCSGEVSEDGHQWCNAAYVTDFTEKAWVNSYARDLEPEADERLTASPAGYLWDNCQKHGKTYRSYGEFASFKSSPGAAPQFTGNKGLEGHASLAWAKLQGKRDYERVDAFIAELKEGERTGQWPQYMVMGLGEDHTAGVTPGAFTPEACVASNDVALGRIVEAISRSKFWKETAIFVMEDDAQDGADHVDAHRTVGFVISPYTRRAAVDHTQYTTVSMIRTMELILGLPPMTQYDAAARPMLSVFATKPVTSEYVHLPAEVDLLAKNTSVGEDAEASLQLDFSEYDRADPQKLNAILWHHFRPGTPVPAPVRSVMAYR